MTLKNGQVPKLNEFYARKLIQKHRRVFLNDHRPKILIPAPPNRINAENHWSNLHLHVVNSTRSFCGHSEPRSGRYPRNDADKEAEPVGHRVANEQSQETQQPAANARVQRPAPCADLYRFFLQS